MWQVWDDQLSPSFKYIRFKSRPGYDKALCYNSMQKDCRRRSQTCSLSETQQAQLLSYQCKYIYIYIHSIGLYVYTYSNFHYMFPICINCWVKSKKLNRNPPSFSPVPLPAPPLWSSSRSPISRALAESSPPPPLPVLTPALTPARHQPVPRRVVASARHWSSGPEQLHCNSESS